MENRFEKFSIAVLELNRYLQKIKDQEMRKFGLRSAHTMCVFYLGQDRKSTRLNSSHS